MTDLEFQAQMEKIYAYNRRNKQRDKRLEEAEGKLTRIWAMLPPPGRLPTLAELREIVQKLRQMREDGV